MVGNILSNLCMMWDVVDLVYKEVGIDIFFSYFVYDLYCRVYKDVYKVDFVYIKLEGSDYNGIVYEFIGENIMIYFMFGMGSS